MIKENVEKTSNRGLELSKLAQAYMSTGKEEYFNTLWYNSKAFAITILKRYPSIQYEDGISIAMECLWNSVKALKPNQNILTLYGTVLQNRLYDLFHKTMQAGKYKMFSEATSLDELKENINYEPTYNDDSFNIEMFKTECDIVGLESNILTMIYEGYKSKEIISKLNLTKDLFNTMMDIIKSKINNNYLQEERGFTR